MKQLYIIIILWMICSCKGNSSYKRYALFKETDAWELAKALCTEDTFRISEIISQNKSVINYQEPKYGNTLIIMSIKNRDYQSCQMLLAHGADPNIHDFTTGSTALILAAGIEDYDGDNTKFIKLLLSFNADPNLEETGERSPDNSTRKNPLLVACSDVNQFVSPIEKVRVLVEAGANVNYKNEYGMSPLRASIIYDHLDVVLYLLKAGADFKSPISYVDGNPYYLSDELRFMLFPLDDIKYKQKMEVVNFLMTKGIDYRSAPIPAYAKEQAQKMYPNNWSEYLEKY